MSLFMTMTPPRRPRSSRNAAALLRTALCVGIAVLATAGATLTLSGCGSSSGSQTLPGTGGPVSRKTGGVSFTVKWPEISSRLIPVAANSVKITLFKAGVPVDSVVLARPPAGGPQTVTGSFRDKESGTDYSALAEAFPSTDASGVAQASAQVGFAIQDNVITPVPLTMDSTIAALSITPTITKPLGGGAQRRLFVSAVDAAGNTVVLPSTALGTITLTSSNPSVVTVTPDNSSPSLTDFLLDVVQPVNTATPITITAKDSESGKTTSITITIVPVGLNNEVGATPKFRVDERNTGQSTNYGPFKDPAAPSPTVAQLFGTGDDIIQASPAIAADGTVYIGSLDGKLYAYDSAGGNLRWSVDTGGSIDSSPAISRDGTIFIGSESGKLYAISPNGSISFTFDAGGRIDTPPAIGPDGTIYFGTVQGTSSTFFAVDGLSGQELWRYSNAGGDIYTTPAILDRGPGNVSVYFATTGGDLVALSSKADANGNPIVQAKINIPDVADTGTFGTSSPVISQDQTTLYIGALNNKVYAFNVSSPTTLVQKWVQDVGAPVWSSLALDSATNRVYVATYDTFSGEFQSKLWALQAADGTPDLSFGEINPNTGSPMGYFLPQEPSDTNPNIQAGTLIDSSPVIGADGMIYFGAVNDRVYAVDGIDGTRNWAVKFGGAQDTAGNDIDSSPAIGLDGAIYIGCVDGNVYQITQASGPSPGRATRRHAFTPATPIHLRIGGRSTVPARGYRVPNFRARH